MARKRKTDFTRCATSFPPEEIEIACSVFMGLLSGADVSMLTRRTEYKTLADRFDRMRDRLMEKARRLEEYEKEEGKKAAATAKQAAEPEQEAAPEGKAKAEPAPKE